MKRFSIIIVIIILITAYSSCMELEDIRPETSEIPPIEEYSPISEDSFTESAEESSDSVSGEAPSEPVSEMPDEQSEEPSEEESQPMQAITYKDFEVIGFSEEEVKQLVDELYELIQDEEVAVSYYYYDIVTGQSIAYGKNQSFRAASVVKAAYALYLIDTGKDLTKEYILEDRQKEDGSGILKNDDYKAGDEFTLETLIKYSLVYSDNTAYRMMYDVFGFDEFNYYWQQYGVNMRCSASGSLNYLGYLTSPEANTVVTRIYELSFSDESVARMLGYMKKPSYNYLLSSALSGKDFARKYGYMSGSYKALHETGVVIQEHPYAITLLSNINPSNGNGRSFFKKVAELTDKFHSAKYE